MVLTGGRSFHRKFLEGEESVRRIAGVLAVLAMLTVAAGAAQAASQALIDAAKREGRVVWYTTLLLDEASGPLAAAFEKKYPGIRVEVTRKDGSEHLRAIMAEAKSGARVADVFDGTTTAAFLMRDGIAESYHADSAADIPLRYKDPNGYWTAQVLYFQTLGYNADLVPENQAPGKYQDLLDPKWKGKLGWSVDEQLTGGLGLIVNILDAMGEEKGMEYLGALAKQDIIRVRTGLNGVTRSLAAKEFAVGLTVDNHHVVIANGNGAHLRWVPISPVLGLSNNIGLIKAAAHPNAAKLLIDFNLSVEGQTVLKNGDHIPASDKVEARDPALKRGFDVNYISPEAGVAQSERGQAVFRKFWRN
jgi:ABC-type Fe3+ transport system substrate-binding protein